MSKKVAIIQILRAPSGGIRKHVYDIIESQSDQDIQQVFITNTKDKDRELPSIKNLNIHHVEISDQPEMKDVINLFKIYKFLKSYDVAVIHGHGAKGGIYVRLLSLFVSGKCIYTPHGGSLHRVYGTIKNKIYSLIELFLVPLTDVFLFESHYSCSEFSNNVCKVKSKSIVNYNGVVIPSKTEQAVRHYVAGEKLKLASFGLLRHLKGHDIAIETCALLSLANIPFEYTIYGKGEERENLLALIDKHNLQECITIEDYSGSVTSEMLRYDFIFHPSRFESFGYVPAEAMSVKVPVIASHEGGLKEVVDFETGFVSLENTAESYFEILKKLYGGDSSLASRIDLAFNKVEHKFSKEVMIKKIEEVYYK